jgi:ABC-type lipoprotein export system ATPase subunit
MEEKVNIVRVTNVTKSFRLGKIDVEALKGIDLEISKGNYISIILKLARAITSPLWGPRGPGKVRFLT